MEEDRTARYANLIVETTNQDIRAQQLSTLFGSAQKLLGGVGHIVIIWLAALMVMKNQFTIGMLVAYATFASQFLSRGDGLVNAWIDLKMLRLYGERLADIALTPPEAHILPVYEGPDPEPNLELRQVSFRYTTEDPWILKGCQLTVKTGQSVAIIGPSGCGKTTLVKLLLGLIAPEEGEIRMGGIDIHKLGLRRYRAMVAAVMQSDQLFAGSIADNIALASHEAHPSEIEQAARMAGIHEQIAAMPMGYRTLVGDMGSALSGGEKQRIILARALFKKPRVLILDEATSHLDVVRERYINDTVSHLSITRIVIAHRPETILQCQLIIERFALAHGSLAYPKVVFFLPRTVPGFVFVLVGSGVGQRFSVSGTWLFF
ncbi:MULTISPECIES: peptidase domain-containing ABC transporter [Acidithiobacillus]|uniref:ATP-binding cassette domain-containing protein n=1 Tax=Acidithiobacillus ferriphilus TaxID=1689834 RepID=A0ABU6FSG4_9PROT|nr:MULTISPECIES: ATP-binding cassette domain-containing protein [Acidithiobacillus]MDA8182563.1 ATP-binding cassette domain-containing protein [Acidithiobacillus sp.]MEB8485845.1 ATP-binding cassette domain-containing protein [Acidithiobacillus ferriphilus]MEB8490339.1 ATP-binding cassette domain-containing protein [Acidithiobacillus ferriphilus]MEB8491861.1 ATP-binding cassette domain-containing protein [Acidithiobacillus ferriphilus]MEB8515003.1 ATP-binding cassette domain-containing protein